MKHILGRVLSWVVTFGGWVIAIVKTTLDLIGYSTAPGDLTVAKTRLEQAIDTLMALPWWVPWSFVLISTLWLMWVSWPRAKSERTQLPEIPRVELPPIAPEQVSRKPELTQDQRDYRIALKKFVLAHLVRLGDKCGRVFSILKAKEVAMNRDQPSSVALHMFIHMAMSQSMHGWRYLTHDFAEAKLEDIDLEETHRSIHAYLSDYEWRQAAIGNLNDIVRMDLLKLPEMQEWLDFDKECRKEIEGLKIWKEATSLKGEEGKWANDSSKLWATTRKVNYNS